VDANANIKLLLDTFILDTGALLGSRAPLLVR